MASILAGTASSNSTGIAAFDAMDLLLTEAQPVFTRLTPLLLQGERLDFNSSSFRLFL